MPDPQEKLLAERRKMVEYQLRSRGISDEAVLDAFYAVPRERFVPIGQYTQAYADRPLPIGQGQTISQPYVVALMLQELQARPNHRVLDVGAGSGYQTALLAHLVEWVYAVERIDDLARGAGLVLADLGIANVTLCTSDGTLGWPAHAPYDGIICGAAAPDVPDAWLDQLAEGGRIVVPTGGASVQTVLVVENRRGNLHKRKLIDVRFVKLIGEQGWPG